MSVIFLDENLVRDLERIKLNRAKRIIEHAVPQPALQIAPISSQPGEVEKLLAEIRRRRKERTAINPQFSAAPPSLTSPGSISPLPSLPSLPSLHSLSPISPRPSLTPVAPRSPLAALSPVAPLIHSPSINELDSLDLSVPAVGANMAPFNEAQFLASPSKLKLNKHKEALLVNLAGSDSDSDTSPSRRALLHPTLRRPKAPTRKLPSKKPNGEPLVIDAPSTSIRDELQKAVRNRLRGWGIKGTRGPEWARVGRKLVYQESPQTGYASIEETVDYASSSALESVPSFSSAADFEGSLSSVASARSVFQAQLQQPQQRVQQQIRVHQQEMQDRVQKATKQAQMHTQRAHQQDENDTQRHIPHSSSQRSVPSTPHAPYSPHMTQQQLPHSSSQRSVPPPVNVPHYHTPPPAPPVPQSSSQSVPHTPPQTPRQQQALPKPHSRNLSQQLTQNETAQQSQRTRDAYTGGDHLSSSRKTLHQLKPTPPSLPRLPLHQEGKDITSDLGGSVKSIPKLRDDDYDEHEESWEAEGGGEDFAYNRTPRGTSKNRQRYDDEMMMSSDEDNLSESKQKQGKRRPNQDTSISKQQQQQQQQQLQLLLQHQLQQQLQQQLDMLQKQQLQNTGQHKPEQSRNRAYHEDTYDEVVQRRRLRGSSQMRDSEDEYERYLQFREKRLSSSSKDHRYDSKTRPRRRHSNPKERTNIGISQDETGKYLLQHAPPMPNYTSGMRLTTNRLKKFKVDFFPSDDRLKELTAIHAHEVMQDANFVQKFAQQRPRSPPSPLPFPITPLPLESPPPYDYYPHYAQNPYDNAHDRDDASEASNSSFSYYSPPAPPRARTHYPAHPQPNHYRSPPPSYAYPPHHAPVEYYPPYLYPLTHPYASPYPPQHPAPTQRPVDSQPSRVSHSPHKSARHPHHSDEPNILQIEHENDSVPLEKANTGNMPVEKRSASRELSRGSSTYVLRGLDSPFLQLEEEGEEPASLPPPVTVTAPKQPSSTINKPPVEHVVLSLLVSGVMALKSTRRGSPHNRYFRVSPDLLQLFWGESRENSKQSSVNFHEVAGITVCMPNEKTQQHFERQEPRIPKWPSLVLTLNLVSRSPVEIIFSSEEERKLWESGLTILWKRACQNQTTKQERSTDKDQPPHVPQIRPATPTSTLQRPSTPSSSLLRPATPNTRPTSPLRTSSSPNLQPPPSPTPPRTDYDSDTASVYTDDEEGGSGSGYEDSGVVTSKKKKNRRSSSLFGSLFKRNKADD